MSIINTFKGSFTNVHFILETCMVNFTLLQAVETLVYYISSFNPCILETSIQVTWQTVKAKMKCAFNQSLLLAKIKSIIMDIFILTYDPLICIMNHAMFIEKEMFGIGH